MSESGRRTALITGASAGIGKAFAEQFAERDHDVVLVARRGDRLQALAAELEADRGVRAQWLVADLAHVNAAVDITEELARRNVQVDVLVNNAGYGLPGFYANTSWKDQSDFIQVMLTAVAQLTHLLLPAMIERGYGRIINVSSVAALVPSAPGHTLYGAAKAFLVRFTESLAMEVDGTGVQATAVCPGFTYSEFHDVTGTRGRVSQLPSFMWMDAETVARQGIDAVMRGQVICVNGSWNRLLTGVMKHIPEGLARGLVRSRAKDFRAPK